MQRLLILALCLSINSAFASELYKISMKSLNGGKIKFSDYKGKALLIVNTASGCGYTPQLKGLQELYNSQKDKGLVVLGFPSDQFDQENLKGKKIAEFCERNYGVKFPIFKKTKINGKRKNKVYKFLTAKYKGSEKNISWNFEKFLVNKKGEVVGRYKSGVAPNNKKLLKDIALAIK